jgi:hypothetical protein
MLHHDPGKSAKQSTERHRGKKMRGCDPLNRIKVARFPRQSRVSTVQHSQLHRLMAAAPQGTALTLSKLPTVPAPRPTARRAWVQRPLGTTENQGKHSSSSCAWGNPGKERSVAWMAGRLLLRPPTELVWAASAVIASVSHHPAYSLFNPAHFWEPSSLAQVLCWAAMAAPGGVPMTLSSASES